MSLYAFAATGDNSLQRLKWSVFHSVSAFCNAGFSLQSNSLEAGWNNPALNVTVALLIVLGGLGVLVLPELIAACRRGPAPGAAFVASEITALYAAPALVE